MTRILCLFTILLFSFPVFAAPSNVQTTERVKLLNNLKAATTEVEGRIAERAIRYFWLKGPNQDITRRLYRAIYIRSNHDFDNAIKILDSIIAEAPDYTEAYNQRAFIYFLQRKFDKALADLSITLQQEPNHFGALTGQAIIFLHQGRTKLAKNALQEAVRIHPWLKERHFLSRLGTH